MRDFVMMCFIFLMYLLLNHNMIGINKTLKEGVSCIGLEEYLANDEVME